MKEILEQSNFRLASGWKMGLWALVLVGVLIYILPKLFEGGLPVRGYGVMMLLGVVSGVGLSAYRARRMGVDPEIILSLAFWMFVAGIVGARAFFVIKNSDNSYRYQ